MEYKAVAFTGVSGSGKTTLIEKIAKRLASEKSLAIVKHDPKNKAEFDREGKDSSRFFKTGANVAVVSPNKTTLLSHRTHSIEEITELFNEFDLMMVEGLKNLPLPRIGIFRNSIDNSYLPYIQAVAIDDTISKDMLDILPNDIDILNLNNIDEIIHWIDNNAKIIK